MARSRAKQITKRLSNDEEKLIGQQTEARKHTTVHRFEYDDFKVQKVQKYRGLSTKQNIIQNFMYRYVLIK